MLTIRMPGGTRRGRAGCRAGIDLGVSSVVTPLCLLPTTLVVESRGKAIERHSERATDRGSVFGTLDYALRASFVLRWTCDLDPPPAATCTSAPTP